MANPPQGWKQGNRPNIYEANIKQVNISTGTVSLVGETNKSNGSYTVYSTSGINYTGGRTPLYTVSSSGARTIQNTSVYNQLQQSGEIVKLDNSIKPKALEINKTFGTEPEKQAVSSSTLYKSLANSAPAAPQQPGQGGTPPPAPQLPGPGDSTNTPNPSAPLSFASASGLRYPKNITSRQDRVKFQAAELLARSSPSGEGSLSGGFAFEFQKPTINPVDGPVIIAIQAPISDQNSVDWGPDSVNAIDSALYNASYKLMQGGDASQQVQDFLKNIINSAGNYQGRIQRLFAGQAASINNILARTDNVVLNPNLELLFQGPQLRPFTFQFKMSARNQPEADEIRRIINYFKYHMAVREEKKLFLKAPHVFKIQYEKGEGELHPGINLISPNVRPDKACALTNCSVDYTPLGSYMTYEDGTMVSYTLSLQFQELTPILDTDYNDIYTQEGSPMSIGY